MRPLVNGCHTKSFDRGHTRFEQHVNKLDGSGHPLKRRLLALCQLILKPKHDILTAVFTRQSRNKASRPKPAKRKSVPLSQTIQPLSYDSRTAYRTSILP